MKTQNQNYYPKIKQNWEKRLGANELKMSKKQYNV